MNSLVHSDINVRTASNPIPGAADVIRATGAGDPTVESTGNMGKRSIVCRKMYLHGGTGNGTKAEQHGEMYDLPVAPTYSECCANIAQAQWNHRLNLLSADAKYAALVEFEMFNSALSGISPRWNEVFLFQ